MGTIDDKVELKEPIDLIVFMDSRGHIKINKYVRKGLKLAYGDQIYIQLNAYRKMNKKD